MNNKPLIIKDVYKGYGEGNSRIEILKNANITLDKGEFVMMLGPSGSGKSTILHLTAGLTPVDSGNINVCGVDIASCSKNQILQLRRKNIGFVFQDFRLLQGLTALENVLVPLYALNQGKRNAKKKAIELLEIMGLKERINHYPNKLSGGEQQRVGIARALANNPQIILADEPTGNLDQKLSHDVVKMLATLPKKLGTTILMVTHNISLTKYATRVIKLVDGYIEVDSHD